MILVQSCGWMETETKTTDLIGNVKILTSFDDMSEGVKIISTLKFNEGVTFKPIIKNCKSILLDSANYSIYIKSISYDKEVTYNIIKFQNEKDLTTHKVIDINKDEFLLFF